MATGATMLDPQVLDRNGVQALIDSLRDRGFTVVGPTVRDGAIVTGEITRIEDLPRGWGDEQGPAHYRLRPREDDALFGFAAPAQSAKPGFLPADEHIWSASHDPLAEASTRPLALLGVRSCDLAAIGIQDRVLLGRAVIDPRYADRRADAFLVAVTCAQPAGTCFCASMGTGPRPRSGHDIALTEILDEDGHRFLAEPGSAAGAEVLAGLPGAPAAPGDLAAADGIAAEAATRMGRSLDTDGLRDLLYDSAESPRWADVAERCLACTNCTLVCPTCFCTSVEDVTALDGATSRHRVWDSCFSAEYSRLHAGFVRTSIGSRYRQWLTHKLGAWVDQFGEPGCVGCGRCITWCPAGIDLTQEVAALRAAPATPAGRSGT